MIENNLLEETLIKTEPIVNELKFKSQLTYKDLINESFRVFIDDLKTLGYLVRKLSKRLYLFPLNEITTISNGEIIEDRLERLNLVIRVENISDIQTFDVYGSDSEDMNNKKIIYQFSVTQTGTHKVNILIDGENGAFRYYQLFKTSLGICKFESYLIETTFDLLHKWLTLAMIFESQTNSNNDIYEQKAIYYRELYEKKLGQARFTYDEDDSGEIDQSEENPTYERITLRRG